MRFPRAPIIWIVLGTIFLIYGVMTLGPVSFLAAVVAILLAITVHECAHAWTADQLGDPTARMLGRVSLNPIVHLDPLGTAMMAMTLIGGFAIGWGKPVPVTPYRLRYGRRLGGGMVSLAGPLSNLLLATVIGLVLRLMGSLLPGWLLTFLYVGLLTNIALAFFNLLPIPPLDGHSVLLGLLSLFRGKWAWHATHGIEWLQRQGPLPLLALLLLPQLLGVNLIGALIGPPMQWLSRALVGIG